VGTSKRLNEKVLDVNIHIFEQGACFQHHRDIGTPTDQLIRYGPEQPSE